MKLFAFQYDIAWKDRDSNITTVNRMAAETAPPPGSLLVLPEMGFTGFSMSPETVADTDKRESESALVALARKHACWVLGGLVSRAADGRGKNDALLVAPNGAPACRYAKIHPFSLTGEHRRFEAGGDVVTRACGDFVLAPFVCYDLRFPEIFRTAARRGATLMAVIANWPEARIAHWRVLLRARAIENQVWVVGVNRCGSDPRFNYPGNTLIVDPHGEIVAEADDAETVISVEASPEAVREFREAFPVLGDIREGWTRP